MSLDEIYDYISVIKEIDKEELEIILKILINLNL